MWLSHHGPDQFDRCLLIGRRRVCRRCLVLYPLAFVCLIAVLVVSSRSSPGWWIAVWWLLPVPALVDWIGELVGRWAYSARRQVLVTVFAAPALGSGLAWWLFQPGAPVVMAPFLTYGVVSMGVWAVSVVRSELGIEANWEDRFERDEQDRRRRLAALVGVSPVPAPAPDLSDQEGTVTKSISSSTAPTNDGSRSL